MDCVEHKKKDDRTVQALRPYGPWSGRAALMEVQSFLRDLLAKIADLALDTDCNRFIPPLYKYIEEYD